MANAAIAWLGVAGVLTLELLDGYGSLGFDPEPGLYGVRPPGWPGALGRLEDAVSYFTLWSNVMCAVAMTLVARHPLTDAFWTWALRLSALLMITITAIVYAVVLAPTIALRGWSLVTNPWQHIVVPVVTVLVWLIWGPRGRLAWRHVPGALVVPLVWVAFMLVRGAIDGTYPYGFTNVAAHGYPTVLAIIGGVLAFGLVLGAAFVLLDALLARVQRGVQGR